MTYLYIPLLWNICPTFYVLCYNSYILRLLGKGECLYVWLLKNRRLSVAFSSDQKSLRKNSHHIPIWRKWLFQFLLFYYSNTNFLAFLRDNYCLGGFLFITYAVLFWAYIYTRNILYFELKSANPQNVFFVLAGWLGLEWFFPHRQR